jgi:hypothetical protein
VAEIASETKSNGYPIDIATTPKRGRGRPKNQVGPHSRAITRGAIGQMNGRTWEAKFIRTIERQLVEHVGGVPSATQQMLISRMARVALRLEIYDEKILTEGALTDHDCRVYGALHNTFRLLLRELGLKPAAAKVPTLAEHLAKRTAQRKAAAAEKGAAA